MAVTSVTGVTDLGSADNQSITKIVFCNIGLKNEQKGRFSNKAVICYKMLRLVTRREDCKALVIIMLHLLQMLQGKSSHFGLKNNFLGIMGLMGIMGWMGMMGFSSLGLLGDIKTAASLLSVTAVADFKQQSGVKIKKGGPAVGRLVGDSDVPFPRRRGCRGWHVRS